MTSTSPIQYKFFLDWSICPTDGILTGTITSSQSGPESNSNKRLNSYSTLQGTPELKLHYQMKFSDIPKVPVLVCRRE